MWALMPMFRILEGKKSIQTSIKNVYIRQQTALFINKRKIQYILPRYSKIQKESTGKRKNFGEFARRLHKPRTLRTVRTGFTAKTQSLTQRAKRNFSSAVYDSASPFARFAPPPRLAVTPHHKQAKKLDGSRGIC
jgi:hypothetical protein